MFGKGKSLILSFDDGPGPLIALNSILRTLREHSITAEFYVLGKEVQEFPDATKTIANQGHKIQNHSWDHPNLQTASKEIVRTQLEKTQQIVKATVGTAATKIRPPYGAGGWPGRYDPEIAEVAQSLSLKIENWDIDTEDWKTPQGIGPGKLKSIEKQFKAKSGKAILNTLMHVQEGTARDLPAFISHLKEWGFSFGRP